MTNRTFSAEHITSGKRSFLVSTYEGFWLRYRDMLPDHRHYYEIIQESYPCHLYFGMQPCLDIDSQPQLPTVSFELQLLRASFFAWYLLWLQHSAAQHDNTQHSMDVCNDAARSTDRQCFVVQIWSFKRNTTKLLMVKAW